MKTNTIKYSVSLPDIHKLLEMDSPEEIRKTLRKLEGQGVKFQDPIAELEGRSIYDYFLISNRSLVDIKMFHSAGLNYEGGRDSSETLVFKAAFKKRPEVFAWLINDIMSQEKDTFDANKFDYSHRATPFYIAASSNLSDVMSTLSEMGVDYKTKNRFGQTVLQNYLKFTKQLRKQTLEDLFEGSKKAGVDTHWLINEPDQDGHTPIMTLLFRANRRSKADKERCLRSLKFFLNNGADPSHQDRRGYTPLMWAAIEGDVDQMSLLINNGANVASFNHAGDSALTLAVIKGDKESSRCILESGIDPNETMEGKSFKNPLLIACQNDATEIALDLLDFGAEPNISNGHHDNHTPLIYAIKNGNRELVLKLIQRGADPNRENNHGMTPLMYAIYNFRGNPSIQSEIIEDLINSGSSLTQQNNKGMTATQLVSELNLEIKIGKLMYERNLDYIAENYFSGDVAQAKKHLVNENSDVFELLHSDKIEENDHMVTFMREKSDHLRETQRESDKQYVTEGYRLMSRAVFVVTPSVTAVSTTLESLMKDNGNSVPLAATAGVAAMAAYFLSHNTEDRKKIRMAIEDAKDAIDARLLSPLKDSMIRGYIHASLYINEKLETLIEHWEKVCDQFSKLGTIFEKSEKKNDEEKRHELIQQLGEMLTDDQLIELIDAVQKSDSKSIDGEAAKIKSIFASAPTSENKAPRIVSVSVQDHEPGKEFLKRASGCDNARDY